MSFFQKVKVEDLRCGTGILTQQRNGEDTHKAKSVHQVVDRWVQADACPSVCQRVNSHRVLYPPFSNTFFLLPQHTLPPVSLKLTEMFPERSFQTSPDAALSHQAPGSVPLWHVSASGTIHYWVNLLHMLVTVPAPPLRPAPATC